MDRAWDERTLEQAELSQPEPRREDLPAVWVVDLRSHRIVRQQPRVTALAGRER